MEVSEEDLSFAQPLPLWRLRLLDLDDHLCALEAVFGRVDNGRAGRLVGIVSRADAGTGLGFNQYFVPPMDELSNRRRG